MMGHYYKLKDYPNIVETFELDIVYYDDDKDCEVEGGYIYYGIRDVATKEPFYYKDGVTLDSSVSLESLLDLLDYAVTKGTMSKPTEEEVNKYKLMGI